MDCLAADWAKLATKLHLRNDDIRVIKMNNSRDSQTCLFEVVSTWLNENYNTTRFGHPSWRRLVMAVMNIDMDLAYDIGNRHSIYHAGKVLTLWCHPQNCYFPV